MKHRFFWWGTSGSLARTSSRRTVYGGLTENKLQRVCSCGNTSVSETMWLTDEFLIVLKQWSSVAQRKKMFQAFGRHTIFNRRRHFHGIWFISENTDYQQCQSSASLLVVAGQIGQ